MEFDALILSLKVAVTALCLMVVPGTAVAWLLAKRDFPGKLLLDTIITLPLVLPPVVAGFALLLLFGRYGPLGRFLSAWFGVEVPFTWLAAALAAAVIAFPIFVRSVRSAFEGVDPRLEQAAASLGAPGFRVFRTVTLPLAWRGLLAGAALGFARSLSEFGATIIVAGNIPGRTQTLPNAIFSAVQTDDMETGFRLVGIATVLGFLLVSCAEYLSRQGGRRT